MKGSMVSPEDDSGTTFSYGKDTPSLAVRRARLRGSLAKHAAPEGPAPVPAGNTPAVSNQPDQSSGANTKAQPCSTAPAQAVQSDTQRQLEAATSPSPVRSGSDTGIVGGGLLSHSTTAIKPIPAFGSRLEPLQLERNRDAAVLLKNIDQTMAACAANLAELQKVAAQQSEALSTLTAKLQDKSLHEAGVDLSSLSESLCAAMEPMKAVARLVPAMDELSAVMNEHIHNEEIVTPDVLVANLADQLVNRVIDPWTFKSAYMAICPDKQSADLMRGLVELLGTQKLSGELFRAAYEAVQTAQPPSLPHPISGSVEAAGLDPEMLEQVEQLKESNQELRQTLKKREKELEKLLADKDIELQTVQEQMTSRYEEFNRRYAEINNQLSNREEEFRALLENKEMEISQRDSELNILRSQMEELRSQTQEMVSDLQKQVSQVPQPTPTPARKASESPSFFDAAYEDKPSSFYTDTASATASAVTAAQERPVAPAPVNNAQPATAKPEQVSPARVQQTVPSAGLSQQSRVQAPSASTTTANVAVPSLGTVPATSQTPIAGANSARPAATAGRHGTGVRAQVFEVIVRQALAGAPWREICAGPMQVNNITPEEVESEVKRRKPNSR